MTDFIYSDDVDEACKRSDCYAPVAINVDHLIRFPIEGKKSKVEFTFIKDIRTAYFKWENVPGKVSEFGLKNDELEFCIYPDLETGEIEPSWFPTVLSNVLSEVILTNGLTPHETGQIAVCHPSWIQLIIALGRDFRPMTMDMAVEKRKPLMFNTKEFVFECGTFKHDKIISLLERGRRLGYRFGYERLNDFIADACNIPSSKY